MNTSAPLRIIFAGTPEFAAQALAALLLASQHIVAVYTQPDRPAGRGRQLKPSAVKALALAHHLPVEQPASLKTLESQTTLANYHADLMIVAAYGLLLPKAVLATPRLGCVNIHASLLPRWRGAAPIQRAILAGDVQTGITIMQMDEGLDTGAMLLKKTLAITATDTASSLHDKLAQAGAEAMREALPFIQQQLTRAQPQDNALATYAKKLEKDEAWIDWSASAQQIDRQIRAFNPWPITQTLLDDHIVRIWQAEFHHDTHQQPPGTLLHVDKTGIVVACGTGTITVQRCQLPGGKPLTIAELLNGHGQLLQVGKRFTLAPHERGITS